MSHAQLFVIISALAVIVLLYHLSRYFRGNAGQPVRTASGKQYYWHYRPPRGRNRSKAVITIDSAIAIEFTLEREGLTHSFAKWLRIARELETNDDEFDDTIYTYSDSEEFVRHMAAKGALRENILRLFTQASRIESIPDKKLLRLEMKRPVERLISTDEEELVGGLHELARELSAIRFPLSYNPRARKFIAYGFCALFFVMPIVGMMLIDSVPYINIDTRDIMVMALICSLPLSIAILLLLRAVFGASSYGAMVVKAYLILGIIGTAVMAYAGLDRVNHDFDESYAQSHMSRVVNRYTTRHKRSTSYHIAVENWHVGGKPVSFKVRQDTYNGLWVNQTLPLNVHPGHLGFEWVENFEGGK